MRTGIGPAVLTTLISAASAALPEISAPKQPVMATIFDTVLMIFSEACPRGCEAASPRGPITLSSGEPINGVETRA